MKKEKVTLNSAEPFLVEEVYGNWCHSWLVAGKLVPFAQKMVWQQVTKL